jgi:hypothetical protein
MKYTIEPDTQEVNDPQSNYISGYIKLYRSLENHWIMKNAEYLRAFIIMLWKVNYKDNTVLIEGELIECKRGQAVYSLNSWLNFFGVKYWSIQKIRTFFKLLKNDQIINTEGLRKTTRVTIINYESYQKQQQTNNRQTTDKQQGDNTEITTTKESKKGEERKEDVVKIDYDDIKTFFNSLCLGLSKIQKITESRKKTIKARIKDYDIVTIKNVFELVSESKFLNGENKKGWKANFDWIMNPNNFQKILEGNYENRSNGQSGQMEFKYKGQALQRISLSQYESQKHLILNNEFDIEPRHVS